MKKCHVEFSQVFGTPIALHFYLNKCGFMIDNSHRDIYEKCIILNSTISIYEPSF